MVFHYEGRKCCDSCRTSWSQRCDHGATVHGVIAHGSHAAYMKTPASCLVHLREEISFAGGAPSLVAPARPMARCCAWTSAPATPWRCSALDRWGCRLYSWRRPWVSK
ncbi:TPA: hypothetical protein QEM64_003065 [Pseudomonas putida]|nr:hypothetical protein [Pseudomonas putida]HDS1703048.1 hypothetical protein [Pseudomonas putida]